MLALARSQVDAVTWERALSTLGAPDADLCDLLALTRRHGFQAVELRAGPGGTVDVEMCDEARSHARALFREAGLRVLSVASYVRLCADLPDEEVDADLRAHLDLAAALGAPSVRVFPGGTGDPSADDGRARRRLARLAPQADGPRLLLETHDSHPRGRDLVRLLEERPGVGVIWDVAHTVVAGESPATTAQLLADRLALVQVKDLAVLVPGAEPALPGQGVLPLDACAEALRDIGYTGPVSLEWEKAWHPQIPDLETALLATTRWLDQVDPPR